MLALDHQMRAAGLGGNICRLVLRLEGKLEMETLREALGQCESLNLLADKRIRRRIPFTLPYWFSHGSNGAVGITEYKADVPRSDGVGICNSLINHALNPFRSTPIAFGLIHYPDNNTDLVLSWHHVLADARGAELLLAQISNPDSSIVLFDRASSRSDELLQSADTARPGFVRKLMFARRSLFFIDEIHRDPMASFAPVARTRPTNGHSYRPIHFSQSETEAIEANCEQQGAGFYRSLFVLAAVIRALHAVRVARGETQGAYVVPVPQDLRRRGMAGPVLSNHVAFLFYRVEPENLVTTRTLVASLKEQMTEQLRSEFPSAFTAVMGLFRHVPLSLYSRVLLRPSRKKMATLFFSDTGDSLQNVENFLGLPIASLYHLAPVAIPPGVAVISQRFRNRLCIVLSCVTGCLTDREQELFQKTVRAELLGTSRQ